MDKERSLSLIRQLLHSFFNSLSISAPHLHRYTSKSIKSPTATGFYSITGSPSDTAPHPGHFSVRQYGYPLFL